MPWPAQATAPPTFLPLLFTEGTTVGSHRELPSDSPATSTDVSRPENETEDDGDIDMIRREENGRIDSDVASTSAFSSPDRRMRNPTSLR